MKILIIIALCLLFFGALFIIRNLLYKCEQLEDGYNNQNEFLLKLNESIKFCQNKLNDLDHKGAFESDDEIGFFFKEIKNMQNILNQYIPEIKEDNE
jgi:predicted PurR-regulated permease PerM